MRNTPVWIRSTAAMPPPQTRRPAWLNWLILLAFLWSSWQLAGLWLERWHGAGIGSTAGQHGPQQARTTPDQQ